MCKQVITRSTVLFIKLPNYLNRISRRHCMVNGYDFRENKCRSCLWKGTYDRSISLLRGWLLHHTVLLYIVVYDCIWLLFIVVYHHRMLHHHGCCCVFGSKYIKMNLPNTTQTAKICFGTVWLEQFTSLRTGTLNSNSNVEWRPSDVRLRFEAPPAYVDRPARLRASVG